MVEKNQDKKNMPSIRPEDLTDKIKKIHISTEIKEILKLCMAMFSTFQLGRDNKIKDLNIKVTSIQNSTETLEKEISDIRVSNDLEISIFRDEISSLKTKIKAQEITHTTHLNSITGKIDSDEQCEKIHTYREHLYN